MDENLCPECGGKMVSRLNRAKQSRFWGCADYPKCKGTRNVDELSRAEQHLRDHLRSWAQHREADEPYRDR